MKALFVILLVVLVLLLSLPMAMDMGDASCPSCTASGRFALGMCLAIFTFALLSLRFTSWVMIVRRVRSGGAPALSTLFRPPRPA